MNELKETNTLSLSWCDSQWLPLLNQNTVLDYFSERSNPFYDRTCNNEILKMQRLSHEQLNKFTGIEYILLHVQEPILYVIRKQERHSPTQVTPISDYYIIAGVVYQAPDLNSLINSRIMTTVHHLQSAFDESYSYSKYHPSKGYWWEFSKDDKDSNKDKTDATAKDKTKEEATSSTKFQRKRVDILLGELAKKFPPKLPQTAQQQQQQQTQQQAQQSLQTGDKPTNASTSNSTNDTELKTEVKVEKPDASHVQSSGASLVNSSNFRSSGGPPEKKQRIN